MDTSDTDHNSCYRPPTLLVCVLYNSCSCDVYKQNLRRHLSKYGNVTCAIFTLWLPRDCLRTRTTCCVATNTITTRDSQSYTKVGHSDVHILGRVLVVLLGTSFRSSKIHFVIYRQVKGFCVIKKLIDPFVYPRRYICHLLCRPFTPY